MESKRLTELLAREMAAFCSRMGYSLKGLEFINSSASASSRNISAKSDGYLRAQASRTKLTQFIPKGMEFASLLPEYICLSLSGTKDSPSPNEYSVDSWKTAEKIITQHLIVTWAAAYLSLALELDCLTGLLNKSAFLALMNSRLEKVRQRRSQGLTALKGSFKETPSGPVTCLMICDIDDFKMFNSLYGYVAGDAVIDRVGQQMAKSFEGATSPLLCRYGGEEFMALFDARDPAHALRLCESFRRATVRRTRRAVLSLLKEKSPRLARMMRNLEKITVSAGLYIVDNDAQMAAGPRDPCAVIDCATAALSAAKNSGKNLTVCYGDILLNHCTVSEVLPDSGEIKLSAGALHGILPGMEFRIIDSQFNGSSHYTSSSGRERTGVRPQRIKGRARVNAQDSAGLEIQEKISFATLFSCRETWPVAPGDRAIFTGTVIPTLPASLETALSKETQEPRYLGVMKLWQKESPGREILSRGMALSLDTIEASFESLKEKGCFEVFSDSDILYFVSGGMKLSALKKAFLHAAKCIRNSSGGMLSLQGAFANPMEHSSNFSELIAKLTDLMLLFEDQNSSQPLIFDVKSANLLGRWHFFRGNMNLAEELFRQAHEMEPRAWEPLNNLGTVHMRRDMFERAKHFFDRALKLSQGKAGDVHSNLGFLHLIAGWNPSEAVRHLDQALALGAEDSATMNNLAMALTREGTELGKARVLAQKALDAEPESAPFRHTLMSVLMAEGDHQGAFEEAQKLIALAPGDPSRCPDYFHDCAIAAHKAGHPDRAAVWMSRAISLFPPLEDSPQAKTILTAPKGESSQWKKKTKEMEKE